MSQTIQESLPTPGSDPIQKTGVSPTPMAPSHTWEGGARKGRKHLLGLQLAIAAAVLVAYGVGIWFFSSHFVPGTTIDGVDAGMMDVAQLAQAIDERVAGYEQHLTSPDGFDARLTGSEIGLSCDANHVANEALSRTVALLWPLRLLTPHHMLIDASITVDEDALAAKLGEAVDAFNQTAEPPTNAAVAYDEKATAYSITPESVGTALDVDKLLEVSAVACRELRQDVQLGEDQLLQPTVTRDDERLASAVAAADATLAKDLTIKVAGKDAETVTPQMKAAWIYLDDDLELSVDGEMILAWIGQDEKLIEAGNTTDDVHVWELDQEGTADVTYRAVRDADDSCEAALTVIETKPDVTPGAKERGRHLDVNLTTQFVRFYDSDGTVIWDSYFVSGGWDYEKGVMHSTPTGTYAIESKETNKTLIGADTDHDDKPDYESFVNYWMPFLNNDYGFHDATWRSEFGGDIRSWWGSHGCINLPFAKAEELFGLIRVGDEVYIHD